MARQPGSTKTVNILPADVERIRRWQKRLASLMGLSKPLSQQDTMSHVLNLAEEQWKGGGAQKKI